MDTKKVCKECGASLAADAPEGLCPKCLMKVAMGTQGPGDSAASGGAPTELPDPAKLAALFPQLEILELLGRGGMGAVYKARQPALDRLVALKILPQTAGNDAGFAERFNREARALARLSHPNIVAVYDFGQAQGLHYFIMEFVDGPNLRQVQRANKLSTREALQIVPQICEALQFAHDEGVVHRDIKPENVLLDKKGRVKIADFGLAKILGMEPRDLRLTGARDVMGTPHYMAPEQVERPQEVDHRADIYSLGVVFYELLTGELPLGKFAPPSEKVRVDVRLDEVVLHTLEKEPSRRYQHVSEVKTDVESIARSEGSAAKPPPPPKTAGQEALQDAWRQVKGPGAGLMITGLLNWLMIPFVAGSILLVANPTRRHYLFIVGAFGLFAFGGIMFSAGLRMRQLKGHSYALLGSVLAALTPPAMIVGLPVGLWSLLVLLQGEVRAAFAARSRGEAITPPAPAPGSGVWKAAAIIVAALLLLLSIPVGGLFLSIVLPAYHRARQNEQRARAISNTSPLSSSPLLWLREEGIDPAKEDLKTAPHLQVVIEDLQPDGTSRFRNYNQVLVEGDSPLQQLEFHNSDLVQLTAVCDRDGNPIPFTATHQNSQFHYIAPLPKAVMPGASLGFATSGTMRNKLDEEPGGIFTYNFRHVPDGDVPTRRVEVHQLPSGAELLDVSANATKRAHNGRTEVVLDQIVPAGGGVSLSYRYRLVSPENPASTR